MFNKTGWVDNGGATIGNTSLTQPLILQILFQIINRIPGRGEFAGGIDSEALDFFQLEDFINCDSEQPAK
ncbi:hypothetical protein TSAR_009415, partial [Trichomalopsis sarcophagae]